MINISTEHIEVISSIPGRLRLNTSRIFNWNLFRDNVINSLFKLTGIRNIIYNKNTRNTLILYNEKYLNESKIIHYIRKFNCAKMVVLTPPDDQSLVTEIIKSLSPIKLIKNRNDWTQENEYSTSRTLIKTGLAVGAIGLALTATPLNLISVAILSYPGIMFAVSSAAHYFITNIANRHRIFIRNNETIKTFNNTTDLLIDDTVLFDLSLDGLTNADKSSDSVSSNFKTLQHIIKPYTKDFIQKFRKCGFIDITTLTTNKNSIVEQGSKYLGIDKIYEINKQNSSLAQNREKQMVTVIGCINGIKEYTQHTKPSTTIGIHPETSTLLQDNDANINVHSKDVILIPKFLRYGQITHELINRSQVLALTINAIALIMTLTRQIHPIMALSIYIINLLLQIILLQNNTEKYKGVLFNEF